MYVLIFWTAEYEIMLELNGKPSSVTTYHVLNWFSFQNLIFKNLFEISVAEITLK
jgi:hypothetical protein